ncbi:alpha/beta hydrolase [Actinoplanes sp. NPDC026670]|uniref:alpha/beta hydrolase n=1 Tax=Actinoplanes sp. NPDC026670 TaxID=3154700 RepID=UPI0033FEE103
MPRIALTSRKALAATALAGLGLIGGSLLGPARPEPLVPPASLPAWLAEPTAPPDPATATPERVALFFARLTATEATGLTTRYPEIVGNLDGAPVSLRYAANQARRPSEAAGRQTLVYDDRGDGRIAEVLGDLETADRIVILVPGSDNELPEFASGHGGVQRRAPAWQARQLFDSIHTSDRGARVAVIAWLGYDAPEGLDIDAVREDRAASGAVALQRFVEGLVLDRPARSIVVIGHSYGSTVAGLAAPGLSGQVTDLVSIGGPGMGVAGSSDLDTSAQVWACAAPSDWIRRVPGVRLLGLGHGRLPSDPEFGARPLPCDDVLGHDGYFDPGASVLPAITAIVIGRASEDPLVDSRAPIGQGLEPLAIAGTRAGVGEAPKVGGRSAERTVHGAGTGHPTPEYQR